jgi:hypothetical protein
LFERVVLRFTASSNGTLCRKYKLAKNGMSESETAFNRLDEAAPANFKTEWLSKERIAQSSRIQDPAAMDVYEINIKKCKVTFVVSIKVQIKLAPSTEQKGD